MKKLKIGFGLIGLLLLGFQLPASGFAWIEDENRSIVPKNTQGDTVRMAWSGSTFSFYGEEGASYKVIWGDGQTDIVTGKGPDTAVQCQHSYTKDTIYNVLLFGIPSEKK